MHGGTGKHAKNALIIGLLPREPATTECVCKCFPVQDPWHPAQRKKCLWSCCHCKSLGRMMIMQYPQAHVIPGTEQVAVLEVDDNDGENANDALERALAPTIKQTKHNHAIRYCMQLTLRNA